MLAWNFPAGRPDPCADGQDAQFAAQLFEGAKREFQPRPRIVPMVATHLSGGVEVGGQFHFADLSGLVVADTSLFSSNVGAPMSAVPAIATPVAEA